VVDTKRKEQYHALRRGFDQLCLPLSNERILWHTSRFSLVAATIYLGSFPFPFYYSSRNKGGGHFNTFLSVPPAKGSGCHTSVPTYASADPIQYCLIRIEGKVGVGHDA
jgi:hypothetical protein